MTGSIFRGRRFVALASDYDGTLAEHGIVSETTLESLRRFKAHKGTLILATGRILSEVKALFPQLDLFDLVVAENGALLYWPGSGEVRLLGEPPPHAFVERLEQMGVGPISVGHCIVATWTPHEAVVLAAIKDMHLDLSVIFNKSAVMVLPNGVNKATGVEAALAALSLSSSETIAIGDAENDLAMIKLCGIGVAVANAIDSLKEAAHWTTPAPRGEGVTQLLDALYLAGAKGWPARARVDKEN